MAFIGIFRTAYWVLALAGAFYAIAIACLTSPWLQRQ